jgi:hypothetical protein
VIGKKSELTVRNSMCLRTSPNWSERNSTMQAIVTERDEDRTCSTIRITLRRQRDCAWQPNRQMLLTIDRRNVVSLPPLGSEVRQPHRRRLGDISSTCGTSNRAYSSVQVEIASFYSDGHRVRPIIRIEFRHRIGKMRLHRIWAEGEVIRDELV